MIDFYLITWLESTFGGILFSVIILITIGIIICGISMFLDERRIRKDKKSWCNLLDNVKPN